jgi:hypothetical protein
MVPYENAKPVAGFDRRDFIIGAAGVAALGAGLGNAETAVAQTGPSPASGAPAAAPGAGRVQVERRGAVLLIGIDRPQAQNRMDPPVIIGLGKAYYQLEHDDELRVAVLHGLGPNFCMGSICRRSSPARKPGFCRRKTLTTSARSVCGRRFGPSRSWSPLRAARKPPGTNCFWRPTSASRRATPNSPSPKSPAVFFRAAAQRSG